MAAKTARTRQSREDKVAELALLIWELQLEGYSSTAIAGRLHDAGYRRTGQSASSGNGSDPGDLADLGYVSPAVPYYPPPEPGEKTAKTKAKGKCRECGRSFALSHYGVVRKHRQEGSSEPCGGGGQIPV